MPYKNSVKVFEENTLYHIYARGVNKKPIFREREDYLDLKHIFKKYLTKDYSEREL